MPDELDDFQILLQRVCDGSEEAAWELVAKYGDHIRRAVRRSLDARLRSKFDSLDFVQLVWSSFFRARGQAQRFNHPGELVAFLRTMARNKVGMETRRRLNTQKFNVGRERSLDALPDHDDLAPASREETPVATAIAREQWNRIMQDHPEHYQEIIRMRLQGHTCTGIADSLGLSERTVRRFLKKLCRDSLE